MKSYFAKIGIAIYITIFKTKSKTILVKNIFYCCFLEFYTYLIAFCLSFISSFALFF